MKAEETKPSKVITPYQRDKHGRKPKQIEDENPWEDRLTARKEMSKIGDKKMDQRHHQTLMRASHSDTNKNYSKVQY